jgi:nicotinamidase-related amidase
MSCGLEGWEAIDKTVELLASARKENIPVIYVHGLENFPAPWSGRKPTGENPLAKLPEEMRRKANQIVEEIAPQPGELVIQKAAASAFWGTPLMFHLNYEGFDTIIACGETTSGCVRATVVDGSTPLHTRRAMVTPGSSHHARATLSLQASRGSAGSTRHPNSSSAWRSFGKSVSTFFAHASSPLQHAKADE